MNGNSPRRVAVERLRLQVASDLAGRGLPWPSFAAALLAARGRLGLDTEAFARLLGVPGHLVVLLERGHRSPAAAPDSLDTVFPDIDWRGLGVPPPVDARASPARRHPSAHRPTVPVGQPTRWPAVTTDGVPPGGRR